MCDGNRTHVLFPLNQFCNHTKPAAAKPKAPVACIDAPSPPYSRVLLNLLIRDWPRTPCHQPAVTSPVQPNIRKPQRIFIVPRGKSCQSSCLRILKSSLSYLARFRSATRTAVPLHRPPVHLNVENGFASNARLSPSAEGVQ